MRKTHQRAGRAMIAALALAAAIPMSASALQQELPAGLALSVVDVEFLERADNSRIYMMDSTLARIDEFIEAGVEHFELKLIYPDMDTMHKEMLLWSEEIIPHYV